MGTKLLIVGDDDEVVEALADVDLPGGGVEIVREASPRAAQDLVVREDFDLVVCGLDSGAHALSLCREIGAHREGTPVILTTAEPSVASAVDALRAGAHDLVTKPLDRADFVARVASALARRGAREDVKRLRRFEDDGKGWGGIVGESSAMKVTCDLVARVAESDATVLVTGDSGTGKELVARAVHDRSPRRGAPFVAINCAAMPEALLESELFGHVRGAFTDARDARQGLFAKATGGTLFLDEIGEMPIGMQAKLLRALQERTVRPVGGDDEVPFDARIVAATNRDLEAEISAGRFREDLFYRINVVRVHVPRLRDREGDILLLAQHFLRSAQRPGAARVVGLRRAAAEQIQAYPWPGNVRELQNCMERAVALAQFDHVGVEDLPQRVTGYCDTRLPLGLSGGEFLSMEEIERRYMRTVLDALGGNKASAARVLGVDRRTLYRKLERWSGPSLLDAKERGSDEAAE